MKFYSLVYLILLVAQSCNPEESADCHKDLFFRNNSEAPIYIISNPDGGLGTENCNSFTRLEVSNTTSVIIATTNNGCLETVVTNTFGNLLRIYFFSENPGALNCDNIIQNEHFIEFRDYTLEDIQMVDWEIPYP